jgi:hypothetical protein
LLALSPFSNSTVIDRKARPIEISPLANVLSVENANDLPFMTPKQAVHYLNVNLRLLENWSIRCFS